jgi:trk system potassium uptake protein
MRAYYPVFALFGGVLMLFALTMLVPLGFSFFADDGAIWAYDGAIAISFLTGAVLFFGLRKRHRRELPWYGRYCQPSVPCHCCSACPG